jgi:lipopolysaccharide export system protein LptA
MIAFVLVSSLLAAADPSPLAGAPVQPTEITSDRAEMQSAENQTITDCDGHVVVTGTNLKVTCDHLKVISSRVSEHTGIVGQQAGLKSLVATGHVRILQTQGVREATCDKAQVFPDKDEVILDGNPRVVDHGNNSVVTGDQLVMYRNQRRVDGTHVRFELPPIKDLGFKKPADASTSSQAPSSP